MNVDKLIQDVLSVLKSEGLLKTNIMIGLSVSTIYSTDHGYETAIICKGEAWPVERYESKQEAITGHFKWVERAPDLSEIPVLGSEIYNIPNFKVQISPRKP